MVFLQLPYPLPDCCPQRFEVRWASKGERRRVDHPLDSVMTPLVAEFSDSFLICPWWLQSLPPVIIFEHGKDLSGAGGESCNPASYAPEGSVSRRQVGANFAKKIVAARSPVTKSRKALNGRRSEGSTCPRWRSSKAKK